MSALCMVHILFMTPLAGYLPTSEFIPGINWNASYMIGQKPMSAYNDVHIPQ